MSATTSSPRKTPVDLRLLRLARPHRARLIWLVVLSMLHALTVVAAALAAARVVVQVLAGEAVAVPIAALAGALMLRTVVVWLRPSAAHRVSTAVITTIRQEALATVARRGPAWMASQAARSEPVEVAGLLATGLDPLRPWFAAYLPSLVVAVVLPPTVLVLMALLDPGSAAVVALTLPLVPLFAVLVGWATQRRARSQYARGGYLAGHFLDVVRGLVTLKLVDRADRQVQAVRESSSRYARSTTRVLSLAFLSSTALDLVATLSVGLVAVGAGVRLAGGEMALWPALAVILLAPEAYRPLREAGAQFHESAQASAVLDQLTELNLQPAVQDSLDRSVKGGAGPAAHQETVTPPPVEAIQVHVTYPGRRAPLVLPDVQVQTGELAVLLGPSGAGKTTLLRVLAGAQRPDSGRVRVSDAQYVPQRPALPLARTVREALTAGEQEDAEVQAVLASVGLPAQTLDAGLDTALGEDGTGLSAGQRHRLALARAILAVTGPGAPARPVLLLDEPTAHLDATAEASVVRRLQDLTAQGVTVVAAAHRSALIDVADRRIFIDTQADPADPRADAPPPSIIGPPATAHTVSTATSPASGISAAAPPARPVGASAPPPPAQPSSASRGISAPHPSTSGPPARKLLARTRRWWSQLPSGVRFAIASAAGAASLLSGIGLTVAASWMIIRAAAQPPILTLSMAVVAVRGFAIARPLLSYAQRLAAHDAGLSLLATWRAQVVAALVPRVPGRLTERRGRLLSRVVHDVDLRLSGIVAGAVPLVAAIVALMVVAGLLAWLLPAALLPLACAVLMTGLVAPWWAVRADRRTANARDQARADLHDAVIGSVESADELGSRGHGLQAVLHQRTHHLEQTEARGARDDGRGQAASELGAAVLVLGSSAVAAGAWTAGTASAETIGVLILGSLVVTEGLLGILPALREYFAGARAADRLAALAALPSTTSAGPHQPPAPAQPGEGLKVQDLTAGWDGPPPVHGLDLHVEPGQTVLIEGASGTGKTTLATALVGLITPRCGQISLEGIHINDVPGRQWRRRVTLAGEADHIFASTLRENLLLARPDAEDAALQQVLAAAQLCPWYRGLPDGLDTWLDSGGRVLSGGERRRLVIARALLRDPQVLVLDEPSEGLDTDTARALLANLLTWATEQGRILVIFSHRLEGLEEVTQRYRLHQGRLVTAVPTART